MMHIIDTLGIDYEITSLQASSHVVLIVTCKYECKYILQNFTQNLQAVLKKKRKILWDYFFCRILHSQ